MSYLSLFYIGVMLTGTLEDGAAIQDALEDMTHQRSVPNIFIKQQHIGGNSDLQAKRSELPALLEAAGAI
jgi:glutaredoxin 3